jgi:hypothetical protein
VGFDHYVAAVSQVGLIVLNILKNIMDNPPGYYYELKECVVSSTVEHA